MFSLARHAGSILWKRRPIQLTFFVTRKCNARCPFCFYLQSTDHPDDGAAELTLDEIVSESANAGIVASVVAYRRINLLGRRSANAPPDPVASWIDNADRRHLLRYVQTNKVSHDPPPMVETTGHQRPDRGTIDESARRRDYPMSTHGRLC